MRHTKPVWKYLLLAVIASALAVGIACGTETQTVRVVETVLVDRPVTQIETKVETVVVEKEVAGETVRVVETVVVEKPVTRTERVIETVVVEKEVTRTETVVETVVVEKIVEGERVTVVETVVVEKPVTRVEKVVETVVVEKVVEVTPVPMLPPTPTPVPAAKPAPPSKNPSGEIVYASAAVSGSIGGRVQRSWPVLQFESVQRNRDSLEAHERGFRHNH